MSENYPDEPAADAVEANSTVNPTFSGALRLGSAIVADPLAGMLGTPCGPPEGCVAFKGFLSQETECEGTGGVRRLYTDDTFWSWLELNSKDIRAQIAVPPNGFDPRSVVWVHREARVTRCRVDEASVIADEVNGVDPAGGGIPTRPPYH
ncbi:MAG: hypothetical protein QOG94_3769 [Solirubrobacteraceae bacterium]|jgi:hypothetical protein|nr:hypothetical protein [Solirubrobacteraceae bacterium]MEA2138319.1 hypothetical protein [Solirubrobacteraceae bacterium]